MSERMKAVIVDDEAPARMLLREFLAAHPTVEVVAECANGFEAVKAVGELHPDLLLLDIQMPKLDGFEVLELLDEEPLVIFCTAHDEHALRAFEVHAVDYLLKPFREERLAEAVERAIDRRSRGVGQPLRALASAVEKGRRPVDRILIKDEGGIHVLPTRRLDYVEARGDYAVFYVGGVEHRKQQPLGELEEQLDPGQFVRIHRSYLLNVDRLTRLELYAKDSRVAILHDGQRLPVSRSGYARLRELL